MNYKHFYIKLDNGYTIVTPNGELISEVEYRDIFHSITWNLDYIIHMDTREAIENGPDLFGISGLSGLYDDLCESSIEQGDLYNFTGLKFLYLCSYFIQFATPNELSPELASIYATALIKWLPCNNIVEEYLRISADNGCGSDARILGELYLRGNRYGIKKDASKSLMYIDKAVKADDSFFSSDNNSLLFIEALYERNPEKSINDCTKALLSIINKGKSIESLKAVVLLCKILSETICTKYRVDLKSIENILELCTEDKYFELKNKATFEMAKCYSYGVNVKRDINVASSLFRKVMNNCPSLVADAAIEYSNIYMKKSDEQYDLDEAYSIVSTALSLVQDDKRLTNRLDEIMSNIQSHA